MSNYQQNAFLHGIESFGSDGILHGDIAPFPGLLVVKQHFLDGSESPLSKVGNGFQGNFGGLPTPGQRVNFLHSIVVIVVVIPVPFVSTALIAHPEFLNIRYNYPIPKPEKDFLIF